MMVASHHEAQRKSGSEAQPGVLQTSDAGQARIGRKC